MRKLVYILFVVISYASLITYLTLRYRDIIRHPHKYDTVKGWERYVKSPWYWKPNVSFGRLDPPHNSGFVPLYVDFIVFAIAMAPAMLFRTVFPNEKHLYTFWAYEDFSVCVSIFIAMFPLSYYIPMHMKSPICICHNVHYTFKGQRRSDAWEKMTLITLICVCISFLLYLLTTCSVGWVEETRIVYSPALSLHEQVFEYDDVVVDQPAEGEKYYHIYMYNSDGEKLVLDWMRDSDEIQQFVFQKIDAAKSE